MIDRAALLSDLQTIVKRLEADLLERTESDDVPEVGEWLRAEYQQAKDAERTAQTYKQWLDDFITQVAAAWVLSCVFIRFLEDNALVEPPRISGPGSRLHQARDEHTLFFRDQERAKLTDREYLLDIFAGLAKSAAGKELFGQHNPMNALPNWLGPDASGELLRFFQKIDSDSGQLVHDFTDAEWNTRFLGDLYQDLSEKARKKYALLQTPDFVEEFILDRTLEPALDEFGLDAPAIEGRNGEPITKPGFRMIDPACGSGHFLLGSFPRILDRWQRKEPETNIRELVQRTLNSIHGVDINPFAIAIARFRLLLAALAATGETSLAEAPAFSMNLACGDSLYHGLERQQTLGDWTDESHYFGTEDAENLRRILREGTFHAVVANPPYIVPKDRAANQAYRRLYSDSCHRQYSLAVPFMERIFRLAVAGGVKAFAHHGDRETMRSAGYTGQITANSFMKREFGKKLIESFFPRMDLTHVIDTSGAYIPGHGTPTVILFGRNQGPVSGNVRAAMGIRGEPSTPDDPARGKVWTAIIEQLDQPGSESDFVSVSDSQRDRFHKHPWSIGGGGAAELKERLEADSQCTLASCIDVIGFVCMTRADDLYFGPKTAWSRAGIKSFQVIANVEGECVRDYSIEQPQYTIFPYGSELEPQLANDVIARLLWHHRTHLWLRREPNGNHREIGLTWFEWSRFLRSRFKSALSITYGEVATHNHFVLDRGGKVFKQTAPVIKLPTEVALKDGTTRPTTEDDHLALLGLLNSSTACFWMKQVCHEKRGHGAGSGIYDDTFDSRYAFNGSNLQRYPLPSERPLELAQSLDSLAASRAASLPDRVLPQWCEASTASSENETDVGAVASLREALSTARESHAAIYRQMINVQEDLDWQSYRLYGLLDEDLLSLGPSFDSASRSSGLPGGNIPLNLGERAFEIVLARKMAVGDASTTWFERHGSKPITELPSHWPEDYNQLVRRRIDIIESNPRIGLIEQPEYKRRWNSTPWDELVEKALESWLLDRLEGYFDFDGRMLQADAAGRRGEEQTVGTASQWLTPPLAGIELVSVAKLADTAREDKQFMEVGEVYRDDPAFDVQKLVEELVKGEHVPLLPVLRYKASGLRNRAEWEKTWELQRLEDKLRAEQSVDLSDYELTNEQREAITKWQQDTAASQKADDRNLDQVLSIPVPPKYKSSDFISTGGARYWALRGKLDVPKERWVSFPHCGGPDGTLVIAWAGYNHLQLAQAISAYYVDVQERLGGREDARLVPLLGGMIELLPWLKQWHHDIDPEYNQRMDEVFEGFITEEAKGLGMTLDDIKAWQRPKKTGGKKRRAKK